MLDEESFRRVLGGLADGRYHLLLGAGASADCSNTAGLLPLGSQLQELLLAELGVDPDERVSLRNAYDAAVAELGTDYVVNLLRHRYADAEPAPWHLSLPRMAWEAIWSFNVDDTIERAYERVGGREQRAEVRLWRDRLTPFGGLSETVPVVHLHGYVGSIGRHDDPQLVFGWSEYLGAVHQASAANWQTRFRSDLATAPLIVIGARLQEEADFMEVLSAGNYSHERGLPSLIVLPSFTAFDERLYRRWGFLPVAARADRFFEVVQERRVALAVPARITLYRSRYTERTLVELPSDLRDEPLVPEHDFYGGHEPVWRDILLDLDATPKWIAALVGEFTNPVEQPINQRLYLLSGPAFSGKSTALLRIGRDLQALGWEPAVLGGHERLAPDEILRYLADRPRTVLLIDSMHHDAAEVAELLVLGQAVGQRVLIFATERRRNVRTIQRTVPAKYLIGVATTLFTAPTDAFWMSIVERRREHARLGRLERAPNHVIQMHFLQNRRDLFSALATLEESEGFGLRAREVIGAIRPGDRRAFCAVAISATLGQPIPASIVASVSGLPVGDVMAICHPNGELGEWVMSEADDAGLLTLRHRYFGDMLLKDPELLELDLSLGELAKHLALEVGSRLGPEFMRRKTLEHRLAVGLMDRRFVQRIVPPGAADDWYQDLQEAYAWNARYWEQRALADGTSLDKAYSYAQRAVNTRRDGFTLTTLGTVVMRRALAALKAGSDDWARHWAEANSVLVEARDSNQGEIEYPYFTYFGYTVRLLRLQRTHNAEWQEHAAEATRDWAASARRHNLMRSRAGRAVLRYIPPEWR